MCVGSDSPGVPHILFVGYYGRLNMGDDAFCAVSSWGARHYWRAHDVSFLSRRLPELPAPGRAALSRHSYFRGQEFLEVPLQLLRRPLIIYAGGSLFHSGVALMSHKSLFMRAQKLNLARIGAIGVSLGPYANDDARRSIRDFLSCLSFLVLRDRQSYEDACSMDLPFEPIEGFDLAAMLPDVYGSVKELHAGQEVSTPLLGVSVCGYERYCGGSLSNEKRREEVVIEALSLAAKALPITIRFLICNGHPTRGDAQLTATIAEKLSSVCRIEIVPYSSSPREMWSKLAECDAVLATRLHAAIHSYVAGVPFLLIEYHRKCTDFLRDIEYPDTWRIGDADVRSGQIGTRLVQMLTGKEAPPVRDRAAMAAKAARNFTAVDICSS